MDNGDDADDVDAADDANGVVSRGAATVDRSGSRAVVGAAVVNVAAARTAGTFAGAGVGSLFFGLDVDNGDGDDADDAIGVVGCSMAAVVFSGSRVIAGAGEGAVDVVAT